MVATIVAINGHDRKTDKDEWYPYTTVCLPEVYGEL